MITHKEARESHKRLFESYLDGDWTPFPTRSDLDTYRDYINQQEKKDNLLELYRYLYFHDKMMSEDEFYQTLYKIKALEKELEEMK